MPNQKKMAPGGAYMASPGQGLSVMGSTSGKKAPASPVGDKVKLASGRSQGGEGSNVPGRRGDGAHNTRNAIKKSQQKAGY